jgi:hypothetical protein
MSGQNTLARKKKFKKLYRFRNGNYSIYTAQCSSTHKCRTAQLKENYLGSELVGATTHNQSIMPQIPSENNLFITQRL